MRICLGCFEAKGTGGGLSLSSQRQILMLIPYIPTFCISRATNVTVSLVVLSLLLLSIENHALQLESDMPDVYV